MEEKETADITQLKKVAKGAGFVFFGMVLSKIISYFYRIFIARGLGPEGYGMIEIGISVISFVWVFSLLGLSGGVERYVSYYKSKNDPSRLKGSIQVAISIAAPIGILSAVILFFLSPVLSPIVSNNPNITLEMSWILRIMAIAVPFVMMNAIIRLCLRGLQNLKHMVYAEYIIFNSVQLVLVLLFIMIGLDVFGVALAYVLSTILTSASFFYFLQKTFPIISKIKAIKPYRELLFFSLPLFMGSMAHVFLSWTDTLFIGILQNASWSGIYNAALPLAAVLLVSQSGFVNIINPLVIDMYVKGQTKKMAIFYKHINSWMFYAGLPFMLLLLIFSSNALRLVFGDEYITGATALSVLSVGYFISSITHTTRSSLLAMGKTKYIAFNTIISAILNVILNFLLIPIYGITGAAIATAFSLNFAGALTSLEFWKLTGINPFSLRIMRSLAAGIISISFVYLIGEIFWEFIPIYFFIVLLFLFMGLYFILLLVFGGFQKEDIEILKSIEKRTGIRIVWLRKIIKKFAVR